MLKKGVLFVVVFLAVGLAAFGQSKGDSWPPANVLKKFGIEGMPQPAGSSKIYWRGDWAEVSEGARAITRGAPALLIGLSGTSVTGDAIKNWFERNGWALISKENRVYNAGDYQYTKGNSIAYFDFSDGVGQVVAGVMKEIAKNSALYGTWKNPSNGNTLIFSVDGWEWVDREMIAGEYNYDGSKLILTYWGDDSPTTVKATINGNALTLGTFSGANAADFNRDLQGAYKKE